MKPIHEGNVESFRTVTTMSGGALIASISVVQFLASKLSNPSSGWLLPTSWVLFALTIVGAAYAHGALTGMRTFQLRALQARQTEGEKAARGEIQLTSYEDWATHVLSIAHTKIDDARKQHDFVRGVSGWAFILGFVTLIGFAIRNLPF